VKLAGEAFPNLLRCQGAPRDLGFDQGVACADALRALRSRVPRSVAPGPLERDLRRHFPQLAERLEGVARGARVPTRLLLGALLDELGCAGLQRPTHVAALWGFAANWTGAGATLAWAAGAGNAPWLLRQSRPENGFASLEIVTPWLPGGVAGVNAAGLAMACTTLEAAPPSPGFAAPALLLVQECLQRFASVEGAEQWCLHRPAGGRATVLIADAAGGLAGVEVAGVERERLVAQNGILVASDAPVHRAQSAGKEMVTLGSDAPARLALLLQHVCAEGPAASSPNREPNLRAAALDALGCRLWVVRGQDALDALDVSPRELQEGSPERQGGTQGPSSPGATAEPRGRPFA